MNQFLKRSINFFALPIFILIIAGACDKDMNVMLDNSATGDLNVSYADSFSVYTSTVQLQNLPGTGAGSLVVGKATDARFGTLTSSAYFRIGFSEFTNDIPTAATFDSLNLVIKPNTSHYYYGDTTKVQKIDVFQLTQAMETKTITGGIQNTAIPFYVTGAALFKDQTFAYGSTPIGSLSFNPHMRSIDSLNIRLSQSIGQNLFELLQTNDMRVASNENFYEYFKGLVLVPDAANTVALGFSDTLEVKVNYSFIGNDGFRQSASKILRITDRNYKYNHLAYDREGTPFESLTASNNEVATSATSGITFVQAGTGVVAKMHFPSLKEFLMDEKISVNKAELIVETVGRGGLANNAYPAPATLGLLVADQDNVPVSYVFNPYAQGMQLALYNPGNQYGGNGRYVFNVIQYLRNLKATNVYDNTSLLLSAVLPPSAVATSQTQAVPITMLEAYDTFSTFNNVFIATENGKPQIKLNILYTKFR
ncbi:DUF4270 family protein [Sphingobacterium oryzagri]|uniref:DUF4270 family protein n=1 Tax=Sphingobacterium oryzagri TaxID=3025669 RepID=A0ABY7WGZ3_9SPHI|nr:DUF4270 family protein [Sphingobacterium sp. KACC 22765]WDF68902.1 DUF4270 family protein [Sphingobacterium sp. KACC 22765]